MKEHNNILITSLESYLNEKNISVDLDTETAGLLIEKSREQKVLPIVFLKNSDAFRNVLSNEDYLKIKSEVMFSVSSQLQRNAELLRICSLFENNGVKYIVFKGAVCRALYLKNSEYRISSDEDFLVDGNKIESAKMILLQNGYSVLEENGGETKLINKSFKSLLELHSSLVNRSYSSEMNSIGELFIQQLENPFKIKVDNGEINTFSPTFGFLSLCVHFFNHFVRGGIGIRSVMDIACFIKEYSDEIDFEYCFSILDTIKAEKTVRTVIALCVKYFGIESEYADNGKNVDELLDDILEAGAYGTADAGRVHSGTATRDAVHGNGGVVSALFPSKKAIVSKKPELEGNNKEINRYRRERIINFAFKGNKINTVKTVRKRKKLLKNLEIFK